VVFIVQSGSNPCLDLISLDGINLVMKNIQIEMILICCVTFIRRLILKNEVGQHELIMQYDMTVISQP